MAAKCMHSASAIPARSISATLEQRPLLGLVAEHILVLITIDRSYSNLAPIDSPMLHTIRMVREVLQVRVNAWKGRYDAPRA